ncbi:MAG: DUF6647 family protein [Ruegeria sp.]
MLERRNALPVIEIISAYEARFVAGVAEHGNGRTRGLYDPMESTIYLVHPWKPADPQDISVLLHELVHHRQVGHHFYCLGAQEEQAYRLQEDWLSEQGLQADVNWIAIVIDAGCAPKDIHPD